LHGGLQVDPGAVHYRGDSLVLLRLRGGAVHP